jgi:phosphoglucosamine mutase
VLLRPSGTEPVVRVMVEAPTQEQAEQVAERLAAVVSR